MLTYFIYEETKNSVAHWSKMQTKITIEWGSESLPVCHMLFVVSQIFYCLVCEIKPLECRGLLPSVRSDLLPRSVWPSSRLSCLGSLESLSVHSHLQHHRQLLMGKVTETPNWKSSCMFRFTNSQSVINRLLWRCCNCKHAWFNSSWPMFHW